VTPQAGLPIDLTGGDGRAVLWGVETDDLNVNLVSWPEGDGVGEHVNAAVDVLIVVVAGAMALRVDGVEHTLTAPTAVVVPKGAARAISAGAGGARYISTHRRRTPLDITRS